MLFQKTTIILFVLLGLFHFTHAQTPTAGELVGIHVLTQAEIDGIANPIVGTLVFNSDENILQSFSNGGWSVPETVSTFVDNMNGTFTYTNENDESVTIGTIGPQGPKGDQGDPGNAQARVEAKLQVNGVDLVASETFDGGWYKKVTATRKMYVSLNANDVISVWAQRTQRFNSGGNSVTTLEDGSFLLIKKLD